MKQKDHDSKAIVVSQWTSMLNMVQLALKKFGFKFKRIDHSTSPKNRAKICNNLEDGMSSFFSISQSNFDTH